MSAETSICKEYAFEAGHRLPNHDGVCAHVHGHSYRVEVEVAGPISNEAGSPKEGMVLDFHDLDSIVKPLIDSLDHTWLNDTIPIPTAENIAMYLLVAIGGSLSQQTKVHLERVRVHETAKSYAEVRLVEDTRWGYR